MARKPTSSSSRRSKMVRGDQYELTVETRATLNKLGDRVKMRISYPDFDGGESFIHDMSSPQYHWLPPGCLVEERFHATGKVYKYYYDPEGWQYYAKCGFLKCLENQGIFVP
ncbi:uncharacterized protein LOC110733677 [Chenopodium quinoa]|uniref:uncharacterized protein LOC110733677 n=1 Tax=Chenopodium quinoa TaxID=63459 RepID=UPI000B78FA40|nr:uncharacterized protein LOC110733677 [Chenopodium quinoa]